MSSDLRIWLANEVKMACEAEANAEENMHYAAASDRMGCMADWKRAKENARVARALMAEAL